MSAEAQGRARADAFRKEHKLGHLPMPDLVSLIELTQGIDVAVLDADPEEHGMTMRDPVRNVVMLAVARTRNPMRQRSTLAHELAHVLFVDYTSPETAGRDNRSREEIRADAFARHLLVPLAGIDTILADHASAAAGDVQPDVTCMSPKGEVTYGQVKRHAGTEKVSLPELSALVQRFEASPSLVAIQLNKAGLISTARKNEWMALSTGVLASRFGWSDQYHALQQESDTRRAPQRLLSRAIQGYVANTLSLQAIARLRGLPVEHIAAEFDEAGIVPDIVQPVVPPPAAKAEDHRPDTDFSDLDALDELTEPDEVSERAAGGPPETGARDE
jgi:hypothetical protein